MLDLVISMDSTGSMSPCLSEVRRRAVEVVDRLFKDIEGIRIGVIAHGDYCDHPRVYEKIELTNNKEKLVKFINTVRPTGGGDCDECYELILQKARTDFNWDNSKKKVLVMISDAQPHGPNYSDRWGKYGMPTGIDWEEELKKLANENIAVYSVQCLGRHGSEFYERMARDTNGIKTNLSQFHEIVELLLAICYKQKGDEALDQFEFELQAKNRMSRAMAEAFSALSGKEVSSYGYKSYDALKADAIKADTGDLIPVEPARFQVLSVDKDCPIKQFVTESGATFKLGRGFYQFTKTETIQEKKEVVLVDDKTGDMWTGNKAREMIGVPAGTRGRVKPSLHGYTVFVQSTSVNRALKNGTRFLYEVEKR